MKKEEQNICSVCGKPWEYAYSVSIIDGVKTCKHDSDCKKDKITLKRDVNVEATSEALRQASIARQENPVEEVNVVSSQRGSSGRTEKVPKKVVDSILEKVKNEEALQE